MSNSLGLLSQFGYAQNASMHNSMRLSTVNGAPLAYDANGNLTTYGYTWDTANRLSGLSGAQYLYDFRNRHYLYTPTSGSPIRYISLGAQTIAERSTDTTRVNDYVFGALVDEPLGRRASDGSLAYYVVDGLGSVVALTAPSGQITRSATYDEWGNVASGAVDFFGYAGRELARPSAAMWNNRSRYYVPAWGRFMSEDPLGRARLTLDPASLWTYVYGENDPVNSVDPFGLKPLCCKDLQKAVAQDNQCAGAPNNLVTCLALAESNGDPTLKTPPPNTASGLLQVNKDAAKQVNCDFKKLFNVDDNIKCGTLYLCWLMSHFAGPDLNTALKMYHYGPGVKNPNKGQQYANKIQKCASCLDGGGTCDKCNPTNTPKKKKKP